MTQKDIVDKKDIKLMVDSFYDKVNTDKILSPVFNNVAQVNWEQHLPRMYDFWNNLIFSDQSYKGNPFAKHIGLPINPTHFKRWITLFEDTVDHYFSGPVADHTKLRARSIAYVFESKLSALHKNNI